MMNPPSPLIAVAALLLVNVAVAQPVPPAAPATAPITVPLPSLSLQAPLPPAPAASQALPQPFDMARPDIQAFIDQVAARNGMDRNGLATLLAGAQRQPRILDAISRPAERVVPWWEYRARFLTEKRIREGVDFWQQHRERLERIEAETGVDPAYIVAIVGVETSYGRITGTWRVLDALMTLGFDYPPRGEFFRAELEQFLMLAREEKVDPATALGSYAGAMGAPQFIPSSYRRYAVDGGGDGQRNLWADWDDVIASVGNYFRAHGWQRGGPVMVDATADAALIATLDPRNLALDATVAALRGRGVAFAATLPDATPAIAVPAEQQGSTAVRIGFQNFHVITRYNRSVRYAMAVNDLAQAVSARAFAPDT